MLGCVAAAMIISPGTSSSDLRGPEDSILNILTPTVSHPPLRPRPAPSLSPPLPALSRPMLTTMGACRSAPPSLWPRLGRLRSSWGLDRSRLTGRPSRYNWRR